MAMRILSATQLLTNSFRNLQISTVSARHLASYGQTRQNLLKSHSPTTEYIRKTSFLSRLTGEQLWKGCTSVSNAGKKRGRARRAGRGLTKDLNKGQVIGRGRTNVIWPGLNAPVIMNRQIVETEKKPDDPDWAAKLYKLRDTRRTRKREPLPHHERGYSGTRLPGRSIGPPDPIADFSFDGFDTRVVESKIVVVMRGNLGRWRRHSAYVVTGNGKGVAGFAMGKSTDPKAALRKAKNRAAQKLLQVPLYQGHLLYHDFFCQFGPTKIYVTKKPPGYGLVCHRVIKTLCQLIGITDLHARIEGGTAVQHIVKAFFLGLLQMKTYDQLANEKGMYVVEFAKDQKFFPRIVGTPAKCRSDVEIPKNELLDFNQYVLNGKVVLRKKKHPPFFAGYKSYQIYLRRAEKRRSHDPIKFDALVRYGELRSFLTDKYPEAKTGPRLVPASNDD